MFSLLLLLLALKKKTASITTPRKGRIYPKTRKGHNTEGEVSDGDEGQQELGEGPELNFAAHGPNWLVGRSGRTRKTKKDMSKIDIKNYAQLKQLRDELAAEMEEKMNKKLENILAKLAEKNPTLNINAKELCATTVDDGDEIDALVEEEEEEEEALAP